MKSAGLLLMVSSLFGSVVFADTIVRVTPRLDYAQTSTYSRFQDRWDQKGALLQGQQMGGNYDLVLEKDVNTSEITVSRCPTAKACFQATPDAQADCFSQAQHWQCDTIYKNTTENFCRFYAIGNRAQAVVYFLGDQVIGGLITGPFAFFQKGIGLAATQISTGLSAIDTIKTVVMTECNTAVPADVHGHTQNQAQVKNVKVFTEHGKGSVRSFIELFTPPSGTPGGEAGMLQEASAYPQARQIQLQ